MMKRVSFISPSSESEDRTMPTPGLSLFGFMRRDLAHDYFRRMCVSPRSAADGFDRDYDDAVARLGPPFPNAGQPDVRPILAGMIPICRESGIIRGSTHRSRSQGLRSWSFKLVEVDRLLVYQVSISHEFVKRHSGDPSSPPTIDGMLRICLPLRLDGEEPIVSMQPERRADDFERHELQIAWRTPARGESARSNLLDGRFLRDLLEPGTGRSMQ